MVELMAKDQHCTVSELIGNKTMREQIDIKKYVTEETGLPTLTDIMKESWRNPDGTPANRLRSLSSTPACSPWKTCEKGWSCQAS